MIGVSLLPETDGGTNMNKNILLVDDDEDELFLTQQILVRKGYEVLTATSASIAMDIFSKRRSEIFVVVLDILMPSADGRTLAVKMKAMAPEMPIILFSHYGFKGTSAEWGIEDIEHVMKNDEQKLLALIKEYEQR